MALAIVSFLGFWGVIAAAAWMALRRSLGMLYTPIAYDEGAKHAGSKVVDTFSTSDSYTGERDRSDDHAGAPPQPQLVAPLEPSDAADEILGDDEEAANGGVVEEEKPSKADPLLDGVD